MQNDTTPAAGSVLAIAADLAANNPATPAKPAKQPRKRAAKPSTPKQPKPADTSKRDADKQRCEANRKHVQPHYNGPSLVSHASVPPKLADALARVRTPVQRAKTATARDDSALALALKHSDGNGTFCPVQATADLGALSRLASLGYLTVRGNRVALTKTGAERARNVSRKAG